ncbi:GmrSD restriction endonuclease domain-containing protein [Amorphus sp. MBR-141]
MEDNFEFDDEKEEPLDESSTSLFSEAVLFSSDWTVETILSQLSRENIQLNPNFQRRDAWSNSRKSRFIESIIVGLPIPQLVLAEMKGKRGKYIVLDGKQRLLSLLRYTESEKDSKLGFQLSGLEIRSDLSRKKYFSFLNDSELQSDLDAFLNYTIRTVIIRNWPNKEFLHQVFLRLNTGSVKLSPQELRQAMAPGNFTDFADSFAANSASIHKLINRDTPDPRMRDVEILVRYIAFHDHISEYKGRMKSFLDDVCVSENENWEERESHIREISYQFEHSIDGLIEIFGDHLAKKPRSRSFNRAIFDCLAFYAADPSILKKMLDSKRAVSENYKHLFGDNEFLESIESDTAGLPNTYSRLRKWGESLADAIDSEIKLPGLEENRIVFRD